MTRPGISPSSGGGGGATPLFVSADGSESVLSLPLDLRADRHYTGSIAVTNNTGSVQTYEITLQNDSATLLTLNLNSSGDSALVFIELGFLELPDVVSTAIYGVYRIQKALTSPTTGYSPAFVAPNDNVTSLELRSVTAGAIGGQSAIQLLKGGTGE